MTEKEAEKQWTLLNNYQDDAKYIGRKEYKRDFERNPWTAEDHQNLERMVQDITSHLARIEERQHVIYQMNKPIALADSIKTKYNLLFDLNI